MSIQKLNLRHQQIGRLLMEFKTQREVAHILGLSEYHVSRVVHSPVFREYMNSLQAQADAEVIDQLRRRYKETAARNIAILKSPDSTARQKLKAAGGLLGRTA